jgi:small conductance mechanosensitive channel
METFLESARPWLMSTGLRILLVVAVAWGAALLLRFGVKRFRIQFQARHPSTEVSKRVDTLSGILRGVGLVVIAAVTGMVILSHLGVNLGPMLAAAGVGGLAIGFGAQNLVKDVISGFFIIMEDQVRVGDVVQLNGQGGYVESVTLRHVRLRDLRGTVHFFSNGSIERVANMTKEFSYRVIDMAVAYREDVDAVAGVMRWVLDEMRKEPPWDTDVLEPLEVMGLETFADSALIIRARIKTRPVRQWDAGREFNRRLKKAFDEAGIEIPFPQRTITWGAAKEGPPAGVVPRE